MADSDTRRPNRMYMDDPNIQWRNGKPNYAKADELYFKGRMNRHDPGSLEETVSNIIKTFEMEAVHKPLLEDFGTITPDFTMNVNGGRYFSAEELIDRGTYNVLMHDSHLYDASAQTRESADSLFKTTFTEGFAWEVLEVIHGPPKLVFTWRHWSHMTGPYRGNEPTGNLMEMFGCIIADVTEDLKLQRVQFFYDANPMMAKLQGKCPVMNNADVKG